MSSFALLAAAAAASLALAAGPNANAATTGAPYSLSIDGVVIAQFSSAQLAWPQIELKRGKDTEDAVSAWQKRGPTDATLVMYDADGTPVAKYYLDNAWPSKIEIGSLAADKNELSIERVTLVCDGIRRVP